MNTRIDGQTANGLSEDDEDSDVGNQPPRHDWSANDGHLGVPKVTCQCVRWVTPIIVSSIKNKN
jgi:hypothetical protein